MNLSEFKAWFEGFTENLEGQPNAKQWARIKKRVGEITADSTPYPVFVERYYRPYQPYWWQGTTGVPVVPILATNNASQMNLAGGTARFAEAGRAEAMQITAKGSAA